MAVLYEATLSPTKLELLSSWLPSQPWFHGEVANNLEVVGAFRFDDRDGEVGIETHLLRSTSGQTFQVPVTYRSSPLDDANSFLIGRSIHSVLGERWVYDATGDLTYLTELAEIIFCGGHEAELVIMTKNGPVRRESTTKVLGSGSLPDDIQILEPLAIDYRDGSTRIVSANMKIELARIIKDGRSGDCEHTLCGTWPGQASLTLLACIQTS